MFRKLFIQPTLYFIIVLSPFNLLLAQDKQNEVGIISQRVGDVIDLREKNYYQLFPDIMGFQSAIFLQLPDSTFIAKIFCLDDETEKVHFKRLSESEKISLRESIDQCEEIQIGIYKPTAVEAKQDGQLIKVYEKPGQLNHWKVSGEVLAGFAGSSLAGLLSKDFLYKKTNNDHDEINWGFVIGSTLGNTLGVYLIGNLGDETGDIFSTFIGSLVGTIAGMGLIVTIDRDRENIYSVVLILAQSAGAIIAFNKTRTRVVYKPDTALLNYNEGNWNLCCPRIQIKPNPLRGGDWIQTVNLVSVDF